MPSRALVIVDMLQAYDFEDAEKLREHVRDALPKITGLVDRAKEAGAPVIYVNDAFEDWSGDRQKFLDDLAGGPHADLIEPIVPGDDALFITKARHSAFYETPLEYLLRTEDIESIVMVGQVTEQCILYSVLDAHIRHIPVVVPRDATAHIHRDLADASLRMMEVNMEAEVCDAGDVTF